MPGGTSPGALPALYLLAHWMSPPGALVLSIAWRGMAQLTSLPERAACSWRSPRA